MTSNREDYLKQLYRLEGEEGITNKQLAEVLNVSPASVSEMLAKLNREGLVHYTAHRRISLTEAGRVRAAALLQGHRLWEVFLREHLHYSWSEAHEDAELLEHVSPPRLVERLDAFLHHPERCPHGSIIPRPGKLPLQDRLIPLTQVEQGRPVTVRLIREEHALLDYLEAQDIRLGERAVVQSIGAYEGLVTLLTRGKEIQLTYRAASQVYAEPEDA